MRARYGPWIVSDVSQLKALIDTYVDDHGSSLTWVAGRMSISKSALSGWWTRGRTSPPSAKLLHSLAVAIRVPYPTVLDAVLHDYGYLPEEVGPEHGDSSAQKIDPRLQTDEEGEDINQPDEDPVEGDRGVGRKSRGDSGSRFLLGVRR